MSAQLLLNRYHILRKKFYKTNHIVHRYHKAKPPRQSAANRLSGVALCQRSYCSIAILVEKMFEHIVYKTCNDVRNDSFNEITDFVHRSHPLA